MTSHTGVVWNYKDHTESGSMTSHTAVVWNYTDW